MIQLQVYPRVGGGTFPHWYHKPQAEGLSPRGRGNLASRPPVLRRHRSIPAWAGEPGVPHFPTHVNPVYPRVGGGTFPGGWWSPSVLGLSPRGRGNRLDCCCYFPGIRSIPAWAGEPVSGQSPVPMSVVYPRVGGGTIIGLVLLRVGFGLSPRGRGNPPRIISLITNFGSIPAWAGEPISTPRPWPPSRVYPRVGGGTGCATPPACRPMGLSPRGRGNQSGGIIPMSKWGSIPAWAGEPTPGGAAIPPLGVYPRVGGGTALPHDADEGDVGLSPRGRGNRSPTVAKHFRSGSIPAWAGEPPRPASRPTAGRVYPRVGGGTLRCVPEQFRVRVYPRVGGGTSSRPARVRSRPGLSPRGRGNRYQRAARPIQQGSIPAWAGEPYLDYHQLIPSEVYPRVGGGTASIISNLPF